MLSYGEKRAINEIMSVIDSQWKNGMLPQIRFAKDQNGYGPGAKKWGVNKRISGSKKETSGITQPPNTAIALWYIYKDSRNKKELIPYLEKFYEPLKCSHDFLLRERDPFSIGLAAIFHPWESGTDNSPSYDELVEKTGRNLKSEGYKMSFRNVNPVNKVISKYRPQKKDYDCYARLISLFKEHKYDQKIIAKKCPFIVYDVLFNTIFLESVRSLEKISRVLLKRGSNKKYYKNEIKENKRIAKNLKKAINKSLYDKKTGLYYNLDANKNELIKIKTIHSLIPLFGNVASNRRARHLIGYLKDNKTFNPDNGALVPSTAIDEAGFDNLRYWKGPVWPVTNWLIIEGLKNYDIRLSKKITEETLDVISEGYDHEKVKDHVLALMEYNSINEEYTTPSMSQYSHGWLWDSGFAAIGWRHIKKKSDSAVFKEIRKKKNKLLKEGLDIKTIRKKLGKSLKMPFFDEYYATLSSDNHKAKEPIGAWMMTWTASIFLDLYCSRHNQID